MPLIGGMSTKLWLHSSEPRYNAFPEVHYDAFSPVKVEWAVGYVVPYVALQCSQLANGPEGAGPVHIFGKTKFRSQEISMQS